MNDLLSAFLSLLDMADQRRQAIIRQDVGELSSCYHRELQILEQITGIQNEWMKSAADYLHSNGFNPATVITVDDVAQHLPESEERNVFLEVKERLSDVTRKIKASNLRNRQLIERRLQDIDSIVGLYQGDGDQVTYSRPSDTYPTGQSGGGNRFESRA